MFPTLWGRQFDFALSIRPSVCLSILSPRPLWGYLIHHPHPTLIRQLYLEFSYFFIKMFANLHILPSLNVIHSVFTRIYAMNKLLMGLTPQEKRQKK